MKAIARYGLFVSLMLAAIGSYAGEEFSVAEAYKRISEL